MLSGRENSARVKENAPAIHWGSPGRSLAYGSRSVDGAEHAALLTAKLIVCGVSTTAQEGGREPGTTLEDPAQDGDRVRDVGTAIIVGVERVGTVVPCVQVAKNDLDDQDGVTNIDTAIAIGIATIEVLDRRRRSFGTDNHDLVRLTIAGGRDLVGITVKVRDVTDEEARASHTGLKIKSEEVPTFEASGGSTTEESVDLARSGDSGSNGEAIAYAMGVTSIVGNQEFDETIIVGTETTGEAQGVISVGDTKLESKSRKLIVHIDNNKTLCVGSKTETVVAYRRLHNFAIGCICTISICTVNIAITIIVCAIVTDLDGGATGRKNLAVDQGLGKLRFTGHGDVQRNGRTVVAELVVGKTNHGRLTGNGIHIVGQLRQRVGLANRQGRRGDKRENNRRDKSLGGVNRRTDGGRHVEERIDQCSLCIGTTKVIKPGTITSAGGNRKRVAIMREAIGPTLDSGRLGYGLDCHVDRGLPISKLECRVSGRIENNFHAIGDTVSGTLTENLDIFLRGKVRAAKH